MIRSIEFRAMNTSVMLAAEGEEAIAGMYAAKTFIDECEQRFSRFLPASELSDLNRSAGEWLPISGDLMDMLLLSMKYYTETKGIFDPSILSALKQIGYDRSMDEIRTNGVSVPTRVSNRTSRPDFHEISFDLANNRVCLPRGMEIDLGGIAKGWIVEKAAQLLHQYVEVCGVSARGYLVHRSSAGWNGLGCLPRRSAQPNPAVGATSHPIRSGRDFIHHETDLESGRKGASSFDRSTHR